MNMESMRVRSYRSIAADEHVPEKAAERYRTLKACGNLRAADWRRSRPVPAGSGSGPGSPGTSRR